MDSSTNQKGTLNVLMLPLIICSVFLLAAIGFGVWAFTEREDYKNNSDQKVAVAVQESVERTRDEEAQRYAEEAKKPLVPYVGPSQFGAVRIEYPKTWSAYVINRDSGGSPVDWYLHPNVVPDINNRDNSFALRVEVSTQSYDRSLSRFDSLVNNGRVTVQPYSLPNVPNVVGSRISGEIESNKQGSMVMLPLRNMTLKIYTQSTDFLGDFNDIILPNATFAP